MIIVLAVIALVALPAGLQAEISSGSILALIRQKGGRRRALWLELLFVATLGVPFVVGANFLPAVLMPPIDSGHGEIGILALAVISLLAGLANLRPVAEPAGPWNDGRPGFWCRA